MNSKESLHKVTFIPWYQLGADIFQFDNKNYLVIDDYYSKYIEVQSLPDVRSKIVIDN